jgi:predicted peptidase
LVVEEAADENETRTSEMIVYYSAPQALDDFPFDANLVLESLSEKSVAGSGRITIQHVIPRDKELVLSEQSETNKLNKYLRFTK